MTILTEAEKIAKYDAERSGQVYVAPVMTDAPAATKDDIDRAQVAAWNKMDQDERLFATVVSAMFAKVPESHRAMGEAGMILLADACEGIGEEPIDAEEENHVVEHAYRIAYKQGHDQGLRDGAERILDYLEKKLLEIKAEPATGEAEGLRCGEVLGLEKPIVRAEYLYPDPNDEDDYTTVATGALSHVRFECGEATLIIDADGSASYLALGASSICGLKQLQGMSNLMAILSDPRVQALRRGEVLGLEKPVAAVRHLNNDDADPVNFGKEEGTEYTCGEVQIYFPDSRKYVTIDAFDTYFEATLLDRDLHDLATLLNDPRVAALRRGEVLGLARSEVSE